MDNTFNNAFSPIHNIKPIKQYEHEIETLRTENFNLKSKIAYLNSSSQTAPSEDMKKFVNDAQTSFNILKNENRTLREENNMLKSRVCDEEVLGLREENNKIVRCVENLNKEFANEKEKLVQDKNVLYSELCEVKSEMKMISEDFTKEKNAL
ncbi:hypothetical protein COBT_001554, partial [Conglomerata obtusa]